MRSTQRQLASLVLAATLLQHYGYYLYDVAPARMFMALAGIQGVVIAVLVLHMLFNRWYDWKAALILMAAMIYQFVENAMIAVCGSWYAFVYVGPPVVADKCELMLNRPISYPAIAAITTTLAIIAPRVIGKKWGTLR